MVGYGEQIDVGNGIWEDVITERQHFGDILRNTRKFREGESVNDNLVLANSVSIVADGFASENFSRIRYVVWRGAYWTVTDIEEERPRLILRLGGIYNGPKPAPSGP